MATMKPGDLAKLQGMNVSGHSVQTGQPMTAAQVRDAAKETEAKAGTRQPA